VPGKLRADRILGICFAFQVKSANWRQAISAKYGRTGYDDGIRQPAEKMTTNNDAPAAPDDGTLPQHRWHLAMDDFGVELTDLEYAVMRLFQSFSRWQSECLASVTGINMSGNENALLHIIRMHDRPKTIKDLMHLTNRQDTPNIQYELRKLIKAELIEKYGSARNGIYYITTAKGGAVCDDYARLRSEVLLTIAKATPGIPGPATSATACLEQLEKIYEISAREVATFHRRR
jgi:predicted MarR family transcription regulator